MNVTHPHHPVRIFWLSTIITLALGIVVVRYGSWADLWIYAILVVLEVTFSFDNAVINSKVLARMSDRWQMIFLTVGIFIAVFVVRFALPIIIVMLASGNGFGSVIDMALNDPDKYSHTLHEASSTINAFGGAFLLMIGLSYFINRKKDIHWLKIVEEWLRSVAKIRAIKPMIMIAVALILYITVGEEHRNTVLVASLAGTTLHLGLETMGKFFEKHQVSSATKQVGWAAFASFMYLEVLDASFSFDGVIGAFAITTSVLLIIAGLGAGAIWVRSLTIYLLRTGTLAKYKYLEHGAHWAILALGMVMTVKLFGIEPPEWIVGSLGIVFIATAVISSIAEKRRQNKRHPKTT